MIITSKEYIDKQYNQKTQTYEAIYDCSCPDVGASCASDIRVQNKLKVIYIA